MRNTKAILLKQMASLLKSPGMLVQAAIFIGMALVMSFFIDTDDDDICETCIPAYICSTCLEEAEDETPPPTIVGMFAVMFVGLALVGSASALVYEDKLTNNLRFMTMAGVKPPQYLIGSAVSIFALVIVVLLLFAVVGRYFSDIHWFMLVTMSGSLVSILLGIAIGLSKYPVLATPVSMMLGMGPMLSQFNESLESILRFTYTQQIRNALGDLEADLSFSFMIIGINGAVILLMFVWMHRKGDLRW